MLGVRSAYETPATSFRVSRGRSFGRRPRAAAGELFALARLRLRAANRHGQRQAAKPRAPRSVRLNSNGYRPSSTTSMPLTHAIPAIGTKLRLIFP
jgi:hypothetical protein